jgi:hypothetical protein
MNLGIKGEALEEAIEARDVRIARCVKSLAVLERGKAKE